MQNTALTIPIFKAKTDIEAIRTIEEINVFCVFDRFIL